MTRPGPGFTPGADPRSDMPKTDLDQLIRAATTVLSVAKPPRKQQS